MAPIGKKRKSGPTNESFTRSRKPIEEENRPSKRPRQDEKDENKTKTPKTSLVPKITKAREEDAAFPRGGASVLTPLEHKQIQIEATQEVLFEQNAKSAKSKEDGTIGEATDRKKQKSKSRGKGKKTTEQTEPEEESVKIEGLSYKRIVPGSLVLGQVSQINDHDIALSLPNNLTGYVPITSISDRITERIEAIAVKEDSEEDEEQDDSEDVELPKLFTIGQYLRAYVVSTGEESSSTPGKSKRRIELSLKPEQSNNALAQRNVIVNSTLMASVKSVEDHGLIMDLGLDDSEMRGFMGAKEVPFGTKLSEIEEGAVFLCVVTGLSSNSKIVKLSTDIRKIGDVKKQNYLSEAPVVDAFLPGTAVEVLVTDVTSRGVIGKVMGMVDVTADLMHSGAAINGQDLEKKYKIGSKTKARIICTFPTSDPPKLGVSLLDHVVSLSSQKALKDGDKQNPLDILPLSTIIEEVTVQKVEPGVGLFVDIELKGISGFVHISRVKDGKIETLFESSGPYKVGSSHRGRIVGYNALDGIYLLSLETSVLEQPFLRIEDLTVAEVLKGKVEKIVINASGIGGLLVNLADGITGLVPNTHMSDVQLLHPEKKFKEGMTVTARVLSTDPGKRQIRLTLKKSLVNSEAPPFVNYNDIAAGMQSPGTIVNILPTGAVVQFYGTVRGFLPVAEMSEAYIQDPSQHFRLGQVVNVHVLSVDPKEEKLKVSCKDPSVFGAAQLAALQKLKVGDILSAAVTEKSNDDIFVELEGLGLRAVLSVAHLTDGSSSKNASTLKKIRVGQTLTDLAVLEKVEKKRLIVLTNKPSLVADAKNRVLLRSFDDVKENKTVHGFVKNVTLTGVYIQFGGGLTGLLPKNKLPEDAIRLPDFGMKRYQSLEAKVISVDHGQRRFLLSMVDTGREKEIFQKHSSVSTNNQSIIDPIDNTISSMDDFTLGKLTKAKIASIKDTQINVQLAKNVQGRIDVSQIFDSWDQIKDRKRPLRSFSSKQIVDVRVLGIHDAKNHRFLPITHKGGKTSVFELSAKPGDQTESSQEPLTLDKVKVGSSHIVFVNNVADDGLWVNLSPSVRGKIKALDVSDDVSLLADLESNFPVGSALRVHVTNVDVASNRLDLSARSSQSSEPLTFKNLSKGMVVPGKVTRVNERQIMVQLSDKISAPLHLTDLADDFSTADPTKYSKNDIVRVCVTEIDAPNKRITLSARPSRVLNSSLEVQDPEIMSVPQVKVKDVVRGFVKNISDKGLFVAIGANVTAYIRVPDLSDSYLRDWKSEFEVGQLVKGKITKVDSENNNIQMSLKASVMDENYVAPLTFEDIKVGQIVTGKIRKVEDFGVFIVVDDSKNVSGLCHVSQMADKRVEDVRKLYEEGDAVKAKVLKINPDKKQISFGLKASYFADAADVDEDSEDEDADAMEGVQLDGSDEEEDGSDDEAGGVDLDDVQSIGSIEEQNDDDSDVEMEDVEAKSVAGLSAGGFDWSANALDQVDDKSSVASDDDGAKEQPKKKKKRKAEIQVDRTGDLDANGPQSASDFERLLLGQPDSSQLWIAYMAFQMQLSELSKAREVAERAIKTINIREETEKMNVWIALLNLENAYGSDETVEEAFKRACQYNDAQEIHERLASTYIQSGKHDKADEIFQVLVKKFSQSPTVWYNYAHFLHTTLSSPDRARALLPRATQSLLPHTHLNLTLKFAALEFHSPSGSAERGRTMFEGLLSTFPKRLDIWNQLLDLETQQGDQDVIRGVFERVLKTKGLKPKGAKAWFKRWSEWEEKNGDKKSREKVKAKAAEWVSNAARKKGAAEGNDDELGW
ncbi:related to ribosomal RNA processing protein RRP5 [Phialocephala subalpina]|uniref:rRNA biogenesis protein RRP5 n=1 Tax=Phialocephala subalpina TaxID=576137 RepID=A0A1L7WX85_9HELO|nr:related to ribosomal RNA processing protein RRP5 [Phialocephala subalpina]